METNNDAVEENPPPKSSRSIVQVSSIYIELPAIPVQINEPGNCNHIFTIRGYSVDKRITNPNDSLPFPLDGNPSASVEQLPPMDVPAFRYWRCGECIKKLESASSTERVLSNYCSDRPINSSTSLIQPCHGNAAMVLQETQEAPETVNTEGIQAVDVNFFPDANTVEGSSSLSSPQTIKNARTGDVAAIADENESSEPVEDTVGKNRDKEVNVEIGDAVPSSHDIIPAPQISADAGDISTPSELQKSADSSENEIPPDASNTAAVARADGLAGKVAECESDQCRENENSTGMPRRKIRKIRLLADLLGEKGSSRHDTRETVLLESARQGNAGSEGQIDPSKDVPSSLRSPLRRSKMAREEERNGPSNVAINIKAPKRDTGKAIMMVEAPDPEVEVNVSPSPCEGLFIGTKTERLRRRSDSTPALGRKKNKQSQVLDFGTALPSLSRPVQAPSEAENLGNLHSPEQTDRNHVDLIAGALNPIPLHNSSAEAGLDLSLNSFVKKNDTINQSSGSRDFARKDAMLFGEPLTAPKIGSDGSRRKGPLWDLNERAALNSYNLEKGSFRPQKEMDFLQLGLNEKNSQVPGNMKERDQRADDIPMDIVELLAKQQYERRNGDAGDSSVAHVTSNTARRFLEVEEIRTVKQFAKEFPNFPTFRPVNARSAFSMASNCFGAFKGTPLNLSHMGRNHLKLFPGGETQMKSIYTAFPQNQQNLYGGVQLPPTASMRPGLQCSEPVEPLLLSRPTKVPFGLGVQQRNAAEQHQGKTISDIKADEQRKTEEARLMFPKPGGTILNSKAKGPLDPYANESIPAMQLLSLMDGRSSGAAFNLGPSKVVDKTFAPCSYHPGFSTNERQDFLNGSFFLRQHHLKETSGLGASFSDSYQSSRPPSAVLPGQISFGLREEEMSREKSQKTGNGTGFGPSSSRGKDKQKATLHASDHMMCLQKHHRLEDSRRFNLEGNAISGGAGPVKPSEGDCGFNRNPAEFSLPVAGNEYTLCARDLKFRKRNSSRERRPSTKASGAKRQRVTKAKPGNEHAQNLSS